MAECKPFMYICQLERVVSDLLVYFFEEISLGNWAIIEKYYVEIELRPLSALIICPLKHAVYEHRKSTV